MNLFIPFKKYEPLLKNPFYMGDFLLSTGVLLWFYLYYFNVLLSDYLAQLPNTPLNDELLNALPSVDMDFIASNYIYLLFAVFVAWVLIKEPQRIPFYIKLFTLMYFSKFIILPTTALTYPAQAIHESWDTIYNDLFFSGHTAFPFLCYLITKKKSKYLGYFFLFSTLLEASSVLLMKIHYTIDVYAAPFITYGVFKIGHDIFRKNYTAYDSLINS
jgi:hypothetical protein